MYKVTVLLINMACSALLGALMQVVWVVLSGKPGQLTLSSVWNMMFTSMIVGTICLFVLFQVTLQHMDSILAAILVNAAVVLILCFAFYLQTGIMQSYWKLDAKWIVVLVLGLGGSTVFTLIWYKRIKFYNDKLVLKKASLLEKRSEER